MSIELWMIGRTKEKYLQEGIKEYEKRLSRHAKIKAFVLPNVKNTSSLSPMEIKQQEATIVQQKMKPSDELILLDERGKIMDSKAFARFLEDSMMHHTTRRMIFLIGGAHGFSDEIYNRSKIQISLSKMTFSHQLIRLIFWEQLYRAVSIIKRLPYHNP